MTRTGHRLLGATAGLAVGTVVGQHPAVSVAMAVVAAVVAPWPDVDQRRWWRPLAKTHRAFRHRRLTHWWGLPTMLLPLFFWLTGPLVLLLGAALAGWYSHLAGDWVFGKRGPAVTGWRGPGIPLAPWWGYHGLGLKCGGKAERWAAWPALAGTLVVQAWALA